VCNNLSQQCGMKKILVISKKKEVYQLLKTNINLIQNHEFEVIHSPHHRGILSKIKSESIDIIISQISENKVHALRHKRLAERYPELVIIGLLKNSHSFLNWENHFSTGLVDVWFESACSPIYVKNNLLKSISIKKHTSRLIHEKVNADKLLGQSYDYIAQIGHDIKNYLNIMAGTNSLLIENHLEQEQKKQFLLQQRSAISLMTSLLENVLNFSKLKSGQFFVNTEEVDLNTEFQNLSFFASSLIQKKDIQFEILGDSLPLVLTDYVKVNQILTNLISNSIKYTDHGKVKFSYALKYDQDQTYLDLEVSDTGRGIPKNYIQKIFSPYIQVSKHDQNIGTGLGLSIVNMLVKSLEGNIQVKSKPGIGTSFNITIPISISEDKKLFHINTINALLTDDSFEILNISESFLKNSNIHCQFSSSFEEALTKIQQRKLDIILLDINIGNYDGAKLAVNMRKYYQVNNLECPVIIAFSASSEEQYLYLNDNEVFDGFIQKPFNKKSLISKINLFVEQKKQVEVKRAA
jgi:signal transduction histidine kinase